LKEATLSIKMPQGPVCEVLKRVRGQAQLVDFKIGRGKLAFHHLVEILAPAGESERSLETLRSAPAIKELDIASTGRGRITVNAVTTGCPMCKTISSSDCFVLGARSGPEGEVEWRLLLRDDVSLEGLTEDLVKAGFRANVIKVVRVKRAGRLTARQEEALKAALDLGYFDYPRRVRLSRLAGLLNVTPGSLSETLRRGERNAIEEYLSRKKAG
jgi:predicted DNA binding protein